jgi:uncharacterized protein (DUF1697 family)
MSTPVFVMTDGFTVEEHARRSAPSQMGRMTTYVLLLRGINVGGRRALPMKELTAILEDLGCRNVQTYIQSGNAVMQCAAKTSSQLAARLAAEVNKRRGFEPQILLLEQESLERAIVANPFPEATSDAKSLHLGFLSEVPRKPDLSKLAALKSKSERFELIDRVFYLHAPDGIGRSKLAASTERLLGVPMTDRNWQTVCKLYEMVSELQ